MKNFSVALYVCCLIILVQSQVKSKEHYDGKGFLNKPKPDATTERTPVQKWKNAKSH